MLNRTTSTVLFVIVAIIFMSGCSSQKKQQENLLSEKAISEAKSISTPEEQDNNDEISEAILRNKSMKYTELALKFKEKSADEVINDNKKIAYLTFDDTMSENTARILDTLAKYNIKATFFPNLELDGKNSEFEKRMLKRMADEGHEIGNHTASHKYSYIYSSIDKYMEDTEKLNDFIYEAAGMRPKLIRFPGGSNNQVSWAYGGRLFMKKLISTVREQGYQYFDWNVSSADAAADTVPKETIVKNVLQGAKGKNKAIILMHGSRLKTTSTEALPQVIEGLKVMGYEFDALSKDAFTVQFIK